jgi:3-oxoacyl-[acyl-carrier protein] reductase
MDFGSEFVGKKVVITGAGGVIGRWLAEGFQNVGATICLTDINQAKLDKQLADLGAAEGSFALAADLTDADSIAALGQAVKAKWGAPDILVNNAGIYPSGFLLDIGAKEWDQMMDINLRAPYLLSREMALLMVADKVQGHIVNISSGASRKMRRSVVPYCVSKTALDRLTKGLAIELAEYGIRANAVEPGFAAGSEVSDLTDEHVANTIANIPLGRPSSPEDAVSAVLYLSSKAGSYVTGATMTVDGGNSIGSTAVYQAKKHAL